MIHGILNVYKEKGYTSHDVVARLRGIAGQRKIGHTGTLDPDAEGVLPVCLGKATKVCGILTDSDKVYETVLLLGKETDTQDISGNVLRETHVPDISDTEVKRIIESFIGEYSQIPPMYSALKVGGRKLYELAREGKSVERQARTVYIRNICIKEINLPRIRMEVSCSKGTYIRTLCHDIGERLMTGGCMEQLIRTKAAGFSLGNSKTLDEIQKIKDEGKLDEIIVPVDEIFSPYRKVNVTGRQEELLYNGNTFFIKENRQESADKEIVRVYDSRDRFVALYRYDSSSQQYKVMKMFFNRQETGE